MLIYLSSTLCSNTKAAQQGKYNRSNENGENDLIITPMIEDLKSSIKMMKAAIRGTTVPPFGTDEESENSGSGDSGDGSGDDGSGYTETTTSNEIPTQTSTTKTDNVGDPEVVAVREPDVKSDEKEHGGANYIHSCVFLLITSLLAQFM